MAKLNDEIKGKIVELYLSGISSIKIGEMFNISQAIISKYIKSQGLTKDRNSELYKNKELQDKVKKLYLDGLGSTNISKILNIPKHNIKSLLKKEKMVRKTETTNKSLYKDFWVENNLCYGYRVCPKCDEKVLCYAQSNYNLLRGIKNKTKKGCLCRKCYGKVYSGENNKFYGKKHSKESIEKMLYSQSKVMKPVSKNEYIIYDILKSLLKNEDIIQQFILENKSYDFYIPKLNLIIEYNGDYWHCNPEKFDENYFNKRKRMFAKEVWDYDEHKLQLCKKYGYILEIVWESNFLQDKNIINNIIKKYEKTAN